MYYTSRMLRDAEIRYSHMEKIIFSLITSVQHLRSYFQAHPIVVLTEQPLRAILQRPNTSKRMAKWAVKLSEFNISFRPKISIKAQALADFIVECSWPTDLPAKEVLESPPGLHKSEPTWILHVEGASNS